MQRIIVPLIGAAEELVEHSSFALNVADEKRACELCLISEMIDENALGNSYGGDQFADRHGIATFSSTDASANSRTRSRASIFNHIPMWPAGGVRTRPIPHFRMNLISGAEPRCGEPAPISSHFGGTGDGWYRTGLIRGGRCRVMMPTPWLW